MPLYHASTRQFPPGTALTPQGPSAYPNASQLMDAHRPNSVPARASAVFAAETPEFAAYYLALQGIPHEDIRLYEVSMPNHHRAPFSLTHAIDRRTTSHGNTQRQIQEYWNPTGNWNFWEFFGPQAQVIRSVPTPPEHEVELVRIAYLRPGNDYDIANDLV